jgi:hypothetical protein
MKNWKALLGIGAACAACCAVPLVGGTALFAGSSALFAGALSAHFAYGEANSAVAVGAAAIGLASLYGLGLWVWRRRGRQAWPTMQP